MSEYECRYLFNNDTLKVYEESYEKAFRKYHETKSKQRKVLTSTFKFDEVDFDTIHKYEGKDKMIIILNGNYYEVDHHKFKDRYSQVFPKYSFPMMCELTLTEYKEEIIIDPKPNNRLLEASPLTSR